MVKCLVTYVTKRMADAILKNNLNQTQNCIYQKTFANCGVNPQKLYCYQFSADFTYFMSLARVVFTVPVDIS